MSTLTTVVLAASFLGLLAGAAVAGVRSGAWGTLATRVLLILVAAAVLNRLVGFGAVEIIETKGSPQLEATALVFCYVSMILGMVAQYFYAQGEAGRKRVTFDLLPFLMPIAASPIVFIPFLTVAGDALSSGSLTRKTALVYLVAFENGFLWKDVFARRTKRRTDSDND